mmetsp:Transcript_11067/g.25148  ORF Transcript_11067/g.25148 Transcript_11067/m.25148 type:complete len:223 (+) Transcript_11067:62-730(+)
MHKSLETVQKAQRASSAAGLHAHHLHLVSRQGWEEEGVEHVAVLHQLAKLLDFLLCAGLEVAHRHGETFRIVLGLQEGTQLLVALERRLNGIVSDGALLLLGTAPHHLVDALCQIHALLQVLKAKGVDDGAQDIWVIQQQPLKVHDHLGPSEREVRNELVPHVLLLIGQDVAQRMIELLLRDGLCTVCTFEVGRKDPLKLTTQHLVILHHGIGNLALDEQII